MLQQAEFNQFNDLEAKTIHRVLAALDKHCPSLKQFSEFNVSSFILPFATMLAPQELIYFEVMLTIISEYTLICNIYIYFQSYMFTQLNFFGFSQLLSTLV